MKKYTEFKIYEDFCKLKTFTENHGHVPQLDECKFNEYLALELQIDKLDIDRMFNYIRHNIVLSDFIIDDISDKIYSLMLKLNPTNINIQNNKEIVSIYREQFGGEIARLSINSDNKPQEEKDLEKIIKEIDLQLYNKVNSVEFLGFKENEKISMTSNKIAKWAIFFSFVIPILINWLFPTIT